MAEQPLIGPSVLHQTPWTAVYDGESERWMLQDQDTAWAAEVYALPVAQMIVRLVNTIGSGDVKNWFDALATIEELQGQLAEARAEVANAHADGYRCGRESLATAGAGESSG